MRYTIIPAALLVAGCGNASGSTEAPLPTDPIGRYSLVANQEDIILLDTATGGTWEGKRLADRNGRLVFVYVKRLDTPDAVSAFVKEAGRASAAK